MSIVSLLETAAKKLKKPKITFVDFTVYRTTKGNYPGCVYVSPTDRDGWYARILTDGSIFWNEKIARPSDLEQQLKSMAADPAEYCAKFGKKSGRCCFCNLELTDQRSVNAGYGPVCAANYVLPWGENNPKEEPKRTEKPEDEIKHPIENRRGKDEKQETQNIILLLGADLNSKKMWDFAEKVLEDWGQKKKSFQDWRISSDGLDVMHSWIKTWVKSAKELIDLDSSEENNVVNSILNAAIIGWIFPHKSSAFFVNRENPVIIDNVLGDSILYEIFEKPRWHEESGARRYLAFDWKASCIYDELDGLIFKVSAPKFSGYVSVYCTDRSNVYTPAFSVAFHVVREGVSYIKKVREWLSLRSIADAIDEEIFK